MEPTDIMQLGSGGLILLLSLRLIFDFLKTKSENSKTSTCLESALEKLSNSIERQTVVLAESTTQARVNTEVLRRLSDDVKHLKDVFRFTSSN